MAAADPIGSALRDELKQIDLPKTHLGSVKTIPSAMAVKDAVDLLYKYGILSAPVCKEDAPAGTDWQEKYTGMLDMIKVIMFSMAALEAPSGIQEVDEPEEGEDEPEQDFFDLPPLPTAFAERSVGTLTEADSGWLPFIPLEETSNLLDAVLLLGQYGLKRAPVINDKGEIVNIVSQTSIVHLLASRLDRFGALTGKTLEELGFCEKIKVLTVRADQPVKDAFDLIRRNNISAVPVMGSEGGMVGNISARHGYYIVKAVNKLFLLNQSCSEFLKRTAMYEAGWNIRSSSIACKATDTLGNVITKMDKCKIHRVYLCDEKNIPIRVIAMTDVLERFVKPEEADCSIL